MAHNHHDNEYDTSTNRRGSSGFGTLIAFGVAALATVSMVAMLGAVGVGASLALAVAGGLGLLGGGLLLLQNHKEKVNQDAVTRIYGNTEGYHKEPEPVRDPSMIHLIKGRSDLPARTKYINDHYSEYGIKPLSADQFRGKHLGSGLAIGLAIAALTIVGITAVAGTGMFALGFAGVMGSLLGGTALAIHTGHTMKRYDAYLDGQAAEGRKRQQEAAAAPPRDIEYDNGCERRRTFCADIEAARRQQAAAEACR